MANNNAHVFLCRMRAAEIFKGFSKDSLVLLMFRKPDNLCGRVVLERRILIDRHSRRQAPSANAIEITRFATPVMLVTVKMEIMKRNVLCETKPATRKLSITEKRRRPGKNNLINKQ